MAEGRSGLFVRIDTCVLLEQFFGMIQSRDGWEGKG